jgi:hypothetical protein
VRRRATAIVAVLAALLMLSGSAEGAWNSNGSGSGYGKARALPTGNTPTANVSGRNVTVSWTAPGGSVPLDGYVVKRYTDGGGEVSIGANCTGTVNGLTCTENDVDPGSWQYTVTPARQSWRGTESPRSSAVTVGSPNLTLNTTNYTSLPATSSGQITNFKAGQTVTYRLDDPTSGTVLSGSITPSPVPSDGTANVSVTIPAGTSNGSHTVYAVGSNGDQASAGITVNVSSAFVATGSYTGNNTDDRAITGIGFTPSVVIVKAATAQIAVARTDTMSGDASKPMTGNTALAANRIQSLDSDGFTVGTNNQVNQSTTAYSWVALRADSSLVKTGSYTGNGTSQSVTGLGFSPEYVTTMSAANRPPTQRYDSMTRSFGFAADTGITTGITSLDANGFSVGNSDTANASTTTYHYFGLNETAGKIDVGTYAGNGLDNRSITAPGFSPSWVMIRANDTTLSRPSVQRPSSLAGDTSTRFDSTANAANQIQALQATGFELGTDAAVNSVLTSAYHYLAVKN